jgi:hypothetical protein
MYRVNMLQLQLNGYSTFYGGNGVGKQARSYLQRMKDGILWLFCLREALEGRGTRYCQRHLFVFAAISQVSISPMSITTDQVNSCIVT